MTILDSVSHPYFKLRWLPNSLADQRSRLQALINCVLCQEHDNPTALDMPLKVKVMIQMTIILAFLPLIEATS
jgi:hypothetical protein